jgi:hypothetical protein
VLLCVLEQLRVDNSRTGPNWFEAGPDNGHMSFYTCFDCFRKLRLFVYVLNIKINVVLKAPRAVVIG